MAPPRQLRLLKRLVTGIIFLGLVAADVALTNWEALLPETCNEVTLTTRMWYQRVVTLGYRKPRPHFVRVVTVAPPPDGGACFYRQLLAKILERLNEAQPAMVVLDYSFSPHECKEATPQLQADIDSLAENNIRVIYGQRTYNMQEMEDDPRLSQDFEELKKAGFHKDDLALWQTDIKPPKESVIGLYRLDCDTRRLPVTWDVYEKGDAGWVKAHDPKPTIAFAAAVLDDGTLRNLASVYHDENPFTSFIPAQSFDVVDAKDILNAQDGVDHWSLRHKIVVVGDAVSDMRQSVIGRVPGVILQSNYIESLLDDRYFRGLGPIMTGITAFLPLLIIALIFELSSKLGSALFIAFSFWLFLVVVTYVFFFHFAVLLTFWVPALPAIVAGFIAKAHSV